MAKYVLVALWGWILCLSSRFSSLPEPPPASWLFRAVQLAIMGCCSGLLLFTTSPPMYHAYVFFAILWSSEAVRNWSRIRSLASSPAVSFASLVVVVFMVESLVVGFYWRPMYSVLLGLLGVGAAAVWEAPAWGLVLGLMSVFPLIPATYGTDVTLQVVGGLLAAGVSFFGGAHHAATALIGMSLVNATVFRSFFVSWSAMVLSVGVFYWQRPSPVAAFALLAPTYVLLSISYESIFFVVLAFALHGWIAVENRLRRTASAFHDVRGALLYLLFTYASFFGTGNTGSLSSFEISSTYRFVSVFSPFLMGALLLVKVVIPFVLVGVAFAAIRSENNPDEERTVVSVLAMGDLMAYTFFFCIRDEGSWREIGVSISHFVMSNAQVLAFLLLMKIPQLLGIGTRKK